MAKYRNIETGDVVNDAKEGTDYLCEHNHCKQCPIHDYVHERNPICTDKIAEEAFAKLYKECGFELVNDTDEVESNPEAHTFRLAEILGVEEDQEWIIKDDPDNIYRIHEGERQWKGKSSRKWDYCCQEVMLTNLINNPDLIQPVSLTKWTEREIEIVRAWKTLNSDMTQFTIDAINSKEIEIDGIPLIEDPEECPNFFSCNNNQIKVSDILGES